MSIVIENIFLIIKKDLYPGCQSPKLFLFSLYHFTFLEKGEKEECKVKKGLQSHCNIHEYTDASVALIISNYLHLNAVEGMFGYGHHEEVNKSSPQKKKKCTNWTKLFKTTISGLWKLSKGRQQNKKQLFLKNCQRFG